MRRRAVHLVLALLAAILALKAGGLSPQAQAVESPALVGIRRAAIDPLEITWNPQLAGPSFISGRIPVTEVSALSSRNAGRLALKFLTVYKADFGFLDPPGELEPVEVIRDSLGMVHVTLQQRHEGLDVYGGIVRAHFSADGEHVVAVSSHYISGIHLSTLQPAVTSQEALTIASAAIPNGVVETAPTLVVYPEPPTCTSDTTSILAWLVLVRDDSLPARNLYVIDALDGLIVHTECRLYTGRNRFTYSANHGTALPGYLVLSEGDPLSGDEDVDNAHAFTGDTYDYYMGTFGRDSYDDQGAMLTSTAHYGTNYANAFWNGVQMVYGDHFPVKDIVGHELTHAVTEREANLRYAWQSGALNESLSDVFAAMIDRDDWLIGEDLPQDVLGGQAAIRDMEDPPRFGQPGHTDDWVNTCSDQEGVHVNSGIPNKAYYNIATDLGNEMAEHIFYRALTIYLSTDSTLEEARAATMQAAQDLYGSPEKDAVDSGWEAVGVDGAWEPEANECSCPAVLVLSDRGALPDRAQAATISALLYRARDELFASSRFGQHYVDLFYRYAGEISAILLRDGELREEAACFLSEIAPGLNLFLDGRGAEARVTPGMAENLIRLLDGMRIQADGGALSEAIEHELSRVQPHGLAGKTFDEAWQEIQASGGTATITKPVPVAGETFDDARAIDAYPAIAYDPASQMYLLVWLSARNARLESDGLDVYGLFLDSRGAAVGDEFRISDSNNVARNGGPTVAVGQGEFLVAWTVVEDTCQVCAQRVTDAGGASDLVLADPAYFHAHSPRLAYNPSLGRYVLVYVKGDDYLPPSLAEPGADDCGNSPDSTSSVRTFEFHFDDQAVVTGSKWTISTGAGAFRPAVSYSPSLGRYLIVWESRGDAAEGPFRFDLSARYLDGDGSLRGGIMELASGGDYSNDDNSLPWTPRPAVVGGSEGFLATWFEKREQGTAAIWSVHGRLLSQNDGTSIPLTVAEMTLAELAVEAAPTGFLTAAYDPRLGEYLAAWTSHRELFSGYTSRVAVQRINPAGQLLDLDGAPRPAGGSGYLLDSTSVDQVTVAISLNPAAGEELSEYTVTYARQADRDAEADFDIWGAKIQVASAIGPEYGVWLPLIVGD